MNISKLLREEIAKELRYAAKKIAEEAEIQRKVFFYSAAYGIAHRVINLEYDPQINFAEFVLEVSYNTINGRMQDIVKGDTTVPLIDGFFDKLVICLQELATKIEKDEDIYKTLEKIVTLTHVTTGNGYFLYTKGFFTI